MNTKQIAVAAIIAATKLAMNMVFHPISFGPINFRVSNALLGTLPFIGMPGVVAFFIAGIWTNATSPLGPIDLVSPFIGAIFNYIIILAARRENARLIFGAMVLYGVGIGVWVGWMLNYALGLPLIAMIADVALSNTFVSAILAYPVYETLKRIIPTHFPGLAQDLKA